MEQTKRLLMTFKTSDDKKVSLSIDDPREDITEGEIKSAMDLIVSKNIFAPNGGDIVQAVEAKVVVIRTIKSYALGIAFLISKFIGRMCIYEFRFTNSDSFCRLSYSP